MVGRIGLQIAEERWRQRLGFLGFLGFVVLAANESLLGYNMFEGNGNYFRHLRSAAEQVRDAHLYALAALEGLSFEELNEAVLAAKDSAAAMSEESRQRISEAEVRLKEEEERPRMHTFWTPLLDQGGMDNDANEAMLKLWKASWEAAGWEPVVLTMEDAKKHPDFEAFNQSLSTDMPIGQYDVVCFLRYLAMAHAGGGWSSDYDVFPLNPLEKGGSIAHMPNNGKFTLYEKQLVGPGAVPSLASARATEWERVAHLIHENALEHRSADFWSDFYSFIDLDKNRHGKYNIEDGVLPGRLALTGRPWKQSDCDITKGKIAVHFAHDAIIRGNIRKDETMQDRPRIAQNWLEIWANKCDVAVFEDTPTEVSVFAHITSAGAWSERI